VGYSFVDDTDIIQPGQPGEIFQLLATRMKAAMDTWEGGLWATGGALEPIRQTEFVNFGAQCRYGTGK
jgi:hypothetical protein